VEFLLIKSESLPRLKAITTELDQYFSSLLKKAEERTVYEKKNFTNLAQSLMSLSNKIAFKKKIIFSTVYLLQATKKLNPADKKPFYIALKMFNLRVPSDDAIRYLIQQVSDIGTALKLSSLEKSIKSFIDSRPFYVIQMDNLSSFSIKNLDFEYKLSGGFETSDIQIINNALVLLQKVYFEDLIKQIRSL
jgi:hypothetical protein